MSTIAQFMAWAIAILVTFFGVIVAYKILKGEIKLDKLISEADGSASLARFQFLIFTFVIAMGFFLVLVSQSPPAFPILPNSVLALLGISGGSYVVSKGIQSSKEVGVEEAKSPKVIMTDPPAAPTIVEESAQVGGARTIIIPGRR